MKYKVILVNNASSSAKVEKLLNEGWTIKNAFGSGNAICMVMVKA